MSVKGVRGAAAGVGGYWIWHGGELGAGEVEAVHGEEDCWGRGIWGGCGEGVEFGGDGLGECCLAWWFVSGDENQWVRVYLRDEPEPGMPPIPITG